MNTKQKYIIKNLVENPNSYIMIEKNKLKDIKLALKEAAANELL